MYSHLQAVDIKDKMIYPVSPFLIANAFLVHALSFPPARTSLLFDNDLFLTHDGLVIDTLVAKAIDCSETKIWHQQTSNMMADVQDADKFVGEY